MNREWPERKRVRLENYDYSTPGYYFITLCTQNKEKWLCNIVGTVVHDGPKIELTRVGQIVENEIRKIDGYYDNVFVDKYIIMPNHVHMIIHIAERINPFPTMKRYDIPNVIGKFKAAVSRNVGKAFMPSATRRSIWQSSYHDHVIRGEKDYLKIWEYIDTNPAKWADDCFYVQ